MSMFLVCITAELLNIQYIHLTSWDIAPHLEIRKNAHTPLREMTLRMNPEYLQI
jgi:hypothetical protein